MIATRSQIDIEKKYISDCQLRKKTTTLITNVTKIVKTKQKMTARWEFHGEIGLKCVRILSGKQKQMYFDVHYESYDNRLRRIIND